MSKPEADSIEQPDSSDIETHNKRVRDLAAKLPHELYTREEVQAMLVKERIDELDEANSFVLSLNLPLSKRQRWYNYYSRSKGVNNE